MSAPLSSIQPFSEPVGGMFGGPRGRKKERGAYLASGVGTPTSGYNGDGWYWNLYPAVISGLSGYATPSTETGAPTNAYVEDSSMKVGGGPNTAEVPAYGGTAAY